MPADTTNYVNAVKKIHESSENTKTLLESGRISYIISTSAKGRLPARDSVKLRRRAVELGVPCLTSLDTARALADSLKSKFTENNTELVDINHMHTRRAASSHAVRTIPFTKMQGCGNDYIYINCMDEEVENPEELTVKLADRHFGIGGDGVILICHSDVAAAKMRIFNLDGSEGKMCGNGIRCVGKYLYDNHIVNSERISVETLSGIKDLTLNILDGKVYSVRVDMGKAELVPDKIPVLLPGKSVVNHPVKIGGKQQYITCVSMGNPHCVVFCDDVDSLDLEALGRPFEMNTLFPQRVNTEFVRIIDRQTLQMRVWERGSGETLACGTGACASAVAAVLNGYCEKNSDITVKLAGGELIIRYTDEAVYMTGEAKTVFTGEVEVTL